MRNTPSQLKTATNEAQSESVGDPYFLCQTPIVEPIFATAAASALVKRVEGPVSKLHAFIDRPCEDTAQLAQVGAKALCQLFSETAGSSLSDGRSEFRRRFSHITLQGIADLDDTAGSINFLKKSLIETLPDGSRVLAGEVLAGITDLNDCLASRARRLYSKKGGLCDKLASSMQDCIGFVREVHHSVGHITSRKVDGTAEKKLILSKLMPTIYKAREAMTLIPAEQLFRFGFEQRVEQALTRINDFHLPDAIRALEPIVNDMWEMKNAFLAIEGLDSKLGTRLQLNRSRRSARDTAPKTPLQTA